MKNAHSSTWQNQGVNSNLTQKAIIIVGKDPNPDDSYLRPSGGRNVHIYEQGRENLPEVYLLTTKKPSIQIFRHLVWGEGVTKYSIRSPQFYPIGNPKFIKKISTAIK